MPEPGGTPEWTELAQRAAARLTATTGEGVPVDELEQAFAAVAREAWELATAAHEAWERRFAALYAGSPIAMALTDEDGRIADVNAAFTRVLGYRRGDVVGTPLTRLAVTEADAETLRSGLADPHGTPRPLSREYVRLEHSQEEQLETMVTVTCLDRDGAGGTRPVVMIEDVTELHLLRTTLYRQNVYDSLTGLPNTQGLATKLEATLAGASGEQVALVYLDIDGFRVVNDGLGRGAGDTVLGYTAEKLGGVFTTDTYDAYLARLSGDGFAVLMHGSFTSTDVIALVEDAMQELAEPVYVDDKGVAVSISAGIVVRPATGTEPDDLRRAAEITLHRAKENGRAQWMLFEPELDQRDRRRYGIGAAIGGALENGEFAVEYQPTVKLDGSDEIAVVNAVLRWNHPEHGVLAPSEFYPLADTTGMTLNLGRMLLTQSLTDAAGWNSAWPTAPDVCIRLPTRFAIDPNLVGIVHDQLRETGFPARKLRICADTLALLDPRGEVLEALSVLAELDVKVTLAVTGAADLELIDEHRLPVGFVIVSGPLIDALVVDSSRAEAARGHLSVFLQRAAELGVKRIGAEGVHTAEQARALRELGVTAGRGKLFGNAVGAAEIEAILARQADRRTIAR